MHRWIKRILAAGLLLVLLGGLAAAGLNWWVIHSASPWLRTVDEAAGLEADAILVLGAGIWAPDHPSPMLADRLSRAMELWRAGAGHKLLMSGDHGSDDYDEVNVMKDYAIAAGVPSEDIFMDHAGFSTYESVYRARDVFEVQQPLIVTQHYHMYRALYIADALGLDASGISADTRRYAGQSYRAAREVLARAKDFLQCITQPEPTFLGEAIPITGSGDRTNDRNFVIEAGATPS